MNYLCIEILLFCICNFYLSFYSMNFKSFFLIGITALVYPLCYAQGKDFRLTSETTATIWSDNKEAEVVKTALNLFSEDYADLFSLSLKKASRSKADIVVATLSSSSSIRSWANKHGIDTKWLSSQHEGFVIKVIQDEKRAKLAIIGSDKRGTAYGLMTLSRMMGVSPWKWWADVEPIQRDSFVLSADYELAESPSVAYRGIFINDEDWGLMPWASKNYEPRMRAANGGDATPIKGEIGPYTHDRIFELLLRLKANLFWPAMHSCSKPFYSVEGNQQIAEKYGIIISTSHCEPMMCNINGEWDKKKEGDYNWKTNREGVRDYWTRRVKRLAQTSDCIYTLGMRGTHDGAMSGYKGAKEQSEALESVISEQREILKKYVNKDVTKVPQQFVPYKEVLDAYRAGLQVPEDVTLIWCDDNYGYIRHLPTQLEQQRSGGNGIYYHLSYWGRPHDYLWLATTPPELLKEELLKGYDHGIRKVWVINVGDIKPGEYLTSLSMDMAWNAESFRSDDALDNHKIGWYGEQLGIDGQQLLPILKTYYDLSFALKPEFLGGTRTEEKDPKWKQVSDLPLTTSEIVDRLQACHLMLSDLIYKIKPQISAEKMDAWFQLVEYPISCMAYQNQKMLVAQLSRHNIGVNSPNWGWEKAQKADELINQLTAQYNSLADGKWKGMMDAAPRRLPVFNPVKEQVFESPIENKQLGWELYKSDICIGSPIEVGETYSCDIPSSDASQQEVEVEIHVLPVHPINEKSLRFEVSVDGGQKQICDIRTQGRSEEWKLNVLYNRSVRKVKFKIPLSRMRHRLEIKPLDETIYLQRVFVNPKS